MNSAAQDLHQAEVRLRDARHRRMLHNVRLGAHGQRSATTEPYHQSLENELQARRELRELHPTAPSV